jgi:hypothetical protein
VPCGPPRARWRAPIGPSDMARGAWPWVLSLVSPCPCSPLPHAVKEEKGREEEKGKAGGRASREQERRERERAGLRRWRRRSGRRAARGGAEDVRRRQRTAAARVAGEGESDGRWEQRRKGAEREGRREAGEARRRRRCRSAPARRVADSDSGNPEFGSGPGFSNARWSSSSPMPRQRRAGLSLARGLSAATGQASVGAAVLGTPARAVVRARWWASGARVDFRKIEEFFFL